MVRPVIGTFNWGDDLNADLDYIEGLYHSVIDEGDRSGSVVLDGNIQVHEITLVGDTDFTLNGPPGASMIVKVNQDNAGLWTLTVDGMEALINTGPNEITYIDFVHMPSGWIGRVADGPSVPDTIPASPDTDPPTVPTGLTITSTTSHSLAITWDESTDADSAIDRYEVTVNNGASVYWVIYTYPRTWTFQDLAPSTSYTAKVRAVDIYQNASAWATVTGSTAAGPPDNPPSAPTGLTATPSFTSIFLDWTGSTDDYGVVAYRVSVDGGATWVASSITDTEYTVTGLDNGTLYSIKVQAGDIAGQWSTSASASTTTLTPITENAVIRLNYSEGSGASTNNLSGGVDGVITFPSTGWGIGRWNNGIKSANDSNGSSSVNYSATPVDLDANDGFTVMIDVCNNGGGAGAAQVITWGNSGGVDLYQISSTGSGVTWSGIRIDLRTTAGAANWTDTLPATVPMHVSNSAWHNVALRFNKTTLAVDVFWDGAIIGTHTAAAALHNGGLCHVFYTHSVPPHGGNVDNLRIFDRLVSDSDIAGYIAQELVS
jgi:hypothetical protein